MRQQPFTEAQRRIDSAFTQLVAALDAESGAAYKKLVAMQRFEALLLETGCGEAVSGDPHPRTRALYHRSLGEGGLRNEVVLLRDRWLEGLSKSSSN
jgi:hypothetical protein